MDFFNYKAYLCQREWKMGRKPSACFPFLLQLLAQQSHGQVTLWEPQSLLWPVFLCNSIFFFCVRIVTNFFLNILLNLKVLHYCLISFNDSIYIHFITIHNSKAFFQWAGHNRSLSLLLSMYFFFASSNLNILLSCIPAHSPSTSLEIILFHPQNLSHLVQVNHQKSGSIF